MNEQIRAAQRRLRAAREVAKVADLPQDRKERDRLISAEAARLLLAQNLTGHYFLVKGSRGIALEKAFQ